MRTEIKIAIVVTILLIVFLVIMKLVSPSNEQKRDETKSRNREHQEEGRNWASAANAVSHDPAITQPSVQPCSAAPSVLPAPTLRCYDYFVFPNEGAFHVKTCSAPTASTDQTSASKEGKPTRIFLQWFPVENVSSYKVYCNKGPSVSSAQGGHLKSWPVAGSSYYFESEPLDGNSCWSMVVTALDKEGVESAPSATYTTCTA